MNNSSYTEIYSWFEKSGIISNIRTHLRQNLVNALKNNSNTRDNKPDVRSAKQYVYDMLIAEYLLNYNYAYTLSVFASEAPLLINLNQQTPVSHSNDEGYSRNKLPNDYVYHTLQTLGICPKNSDGKNISLEYAAGTEPLILCILRHLVSRSSTKSMGECGDERVATRSQQTQTDYVADVENHELRKLSEAKAKLYRQKELFAGQLKNKEFELKTQARSVEKQLVCLNEKLQHAQNLMRLVDSKENDLADERTKTEEILRSKELELSAKEKLLAQEADRLQKERDSYRTFEGDMRKLKEELIKVRNDLPGSTTNLTKVKLLEASAQTEITESVTSADELRLLTEEKRELSNMIREQNSRIEELNLRAVSLARQLEEAQLFIPPNIDPSNSVVRRVNVNTIFSESSSTEDILQDAKMRLRRLEEESLRADQYFYNCITSP